MSLPTYLIPFPEGIPFYSSRHGLYISTPGYLPVLQLHNDWDLFWVIEGEATWEFKDGKKLVAPRNHFALLPPFVPLTVYETKPQVKFWYYHFNFRLISSGVMDSVRKDFLGPRDKAHLPLTFSAKEAPEVLKAFRMAIRLKEESGDQWWRFETATLNLVASLARFAWKRTQKGGRGKLIQPQNTQDARIAAICKKIAEDPSQPWTVGQLSRDVGLSPGRLHTLCHRALGKNLKTYIIESRLQKALKLLKNASDGRKRSIKEVSAACGFSSQHFFSRQFKSVFHITPIAYRDGVNLA